VYYPGAFQYLSRIAEELDYELVMVTNQDGLGTDSFPEETFWPAQNKIIEAFKGEGVEFDEILIDRSFPKDNAPTRKPRTGLLTKYIEGEYDLANSYVLGDRETDMELAQNLGAQGIFIGENSLNAALSTTSWKRIYEFLKFGRRVGSVSRKTKETDIQVKMDLDGSGKSEILTGIAFFDHMLEQISKHGQIDLNIKVDGDLEVDEHHTIEDTALALGEAFAQCFENKLGIERYGFALPMDDADAQVLIDFGGRNWLEWEATFNREMVGKMPTEMFKHFFKSFTDTAKCNLNVKANGENEHHKIEAIFKAFAKSIKMAKKRSINEAFLPSTKGVL
ncbi:MAG: bifunctional histidinol-phosphatase/imidazoleglycerol-phosphate dehydratase HisB, partial [Crocinitomicaceae bacterium]|nr:bifunctional histidinol-phosphatase/imidazoleglycerol-phosphate dehydratase HisB [Crocinitomicaceae bacterium]